MLRFYFDFYRSVPKFIITAIFSAALISLIVSPIGFFHYIRISFENLNKYFQNDFAKLVLLLAIATILSSFGNLMLSSVTKLIRHLLFYFVGDRVERGKKIGLIDILVLSSDQLINKFFVVYRDIFTAYFFTYYKAQLYLEKERSAYDFTRTIDSMLSYDNVSFNVFKEISYNQLLNNDQKKLDIYSDQVEQIEWFWLTGVLIIIQYLIYAQSYSIPLILILIVLFLAVICLYHSRKMFYAIASITCIFDSLSMGEGVLDKVDEEKDLKI